MVKSKRGAAATLVSLGMLIMAVPAFAQGGEAQIRVAHLSPDAPNVDVHLDGEPVKDLIDVPFTTVSSYFPVPAGTHNVEIFPSGDTSKPVVEAEVSVRGGTYYTVGVVGLAQDGSLKSQVYEDDVSLPAGGNAKLRAIHAAPDVQAVDIAPEDGEDLFVDLGFPNASTYAEVPAGTYTLEATLTGSGEQAFIVPDAPLSADTVYSVFAVGQAKEGSVKVVLVGDEGAAGGQQLTASAIPLPGTGGPSPTRFLFSAIVTISLAALCAAYSRRKLIAGKDREITVGSDG